MLMERVKTALIILPILLGIVFFGGVWGVGIVIAIAGAIGVGEYLAMSPLEFTEREKMLIPAWGGAVVLGFLAANPALPGALLALGVLGYSMSEAHHHGPTGETLARLGHVGAGWLAVAFCLGHAVLVQAHGPQALFFMMILVMVGDTAAYFTGTAIGKHKLAPKVSPGKTIEGSLGGLAATMAAGYVFSGLLGLPHAGWDGVWIAAAINVAAQAGDLAESLLKRAAGVKDSGTIFPGHGGMLDRVDSFLPTLPLYAAILSFYGG